MLDILEAFSDTMPPTRTYKRRSFVFIPAKPEYRERTGLLGNLLTKVQHSRSGCGRAVEVDSYGIERDTPEPGDEGGAAFWLVNHADPNQHEPYRCVVGGLKPKCGCKAGKCKVMDEDGDLVCKHATALRQLMDAGMI